MATFTGLPDFGRPERHGVVEGYAAFEQPGVVSALPTTISPAPVEGGTGPLLVDVYLQERADRVEEFVLVTSMFLLGVPLGPVPRDDGPDLVVRPAPLGDGTVRLVGPSALGFPDSGLPSQPFDASAGCVRPSFLRLDGVAGQVLIGSLEAGLVAVGADAWLSVDGVAARCPGTLTVDQDAFVSGLGPGPFTQEALVDRLAEGSEGFTVSDGPAERRLLAVAAADRIATRLCTPDFGGWSFPVARGGETVQTWDLSSPAPARRLLHFSCDPVIEAFANGDAIRRHQAPPLTDGRERVLVHTTLPALPAGVVVALVELTAPSAPPDRPFEATASGQLAPPQPTELTLALSPGERLVYDLAASCVMDTDRGPRSVSGEVRRGEDDSIPILSASDLGLRVIPVNATDELLGLGDLVVTATASWSGTRVSSRAHLLPGARTGLARMWLALPRDAGEATLEVTATTRGPNLSTAHQQLPDAAIWLDSQSFDHPPWPLSGEVSSSPVVVESAGLRAVGHPGDTDWRFLPLTAGPLTDARGTAQLSLLEAGPMAMLVLTTALLVSDDQQGRLRTECVAAGAPADVRLSPAPFEAEEASLLVHRNGGLEILKSVTPSGTVSQDAAFTAGLDAADLGTVHRALGGEPGLLAVRYRLRVAASGPEAQALAGGPGPITVLADASTWNT